MKFISTFIFYVVFILLVYAWQGLGMEGAANVLQIGLWALGIFFMAAYIGMINWVQKGEVQLPERQPVSTFLAWVFILTVFSGAAWFGYGWLASLWAIVIFLRLVVRAKIEETRKARQAKIDAAVAKFEREGA